MNTRNRDFLDGIQALKKKGMSDAEIAKAMGYKSTAQFVASRSIAKSQHKQTNITNAQRLRDKGMGYSEIGRQMGQPESTIRSWLKPGEIDKADAITTTANLLRDQFTTKNKEIVDIGKGVESRLGITRTRLDTSVEVLKQEGYVTHTIYIRQIGAVDQFTPLKVLALPKTPLTYVQQNRNKISQIDGYSDDGGHSFFRIQPPIQVNSRRIQVRYAEDGGAKEDGVIYLRPGVKDLSLGNDRYGQVRIAVDGTHYIKGMAIYKENLPPGTDIVFNTNKSNTGRKKDAFKEIEKDPDFPFGSVVRQIHDSKTGKVSSALNIVGVKEGSGVEGSWGEWSRTLSSQMVSKQNPKFAESHLNMTFERRMNEFKEINSLTNPTVKRELLHKFSDATDAASVHLKAANLPRQATRVLLPIPSMKETEVYAPGFKNGERVALVRYPHAGKFEIPVLKVNNRNKEGKSVIGDRLSTDAIGIHHKVAQHLSGADFDGDFVLVIPNNKNQIQAEPALAGLKNFDPMTYRLPKDSPIPRMSKSRKQTEMGKISNLITDMSIQGAPNDELARAVKHSMVVIDAEKHELNYAQSEKDFGIRALKAKYQGRADAGAKTLISRKKQTMRVNQRIPRPERLGGPIDRATGRKVFVETGRTRPEKVQIKDPVTGKKTWVATGGQVKVTREVRKLAETHDAFTLASGRTADTTTRMEAIYATHSNKLKALANEARKIAVNTHDKEKSPSAAKVYKNEVASLTAKLNNAKKNAPLERHAQLVANLHVSQARQANPGMDKADVTKIEQYALTTARARTGAKKHKIIVTPAEWEAIQAGAVSKTKLNDIVANSDLDTVRHLALPKHAPKMTPAKQARAQLMLASGFTQADVAEALGVSLSTLKVSLSE